ncbi:CRTAC1 family protein [Thermogemmata fonticola]|uniref:CRTAC1 family protein n=1 Tax=Thermogemmata fonticola TaxID=2755323 RepID=A0A7V9ACR6_9BACT|nr:CRTAC1 family protein [Thermogemmata fonticola]MBA2227047.1 CRTAC1 family protein [Thermogemmata fonticola]
MKCPTLERRYLLGLLLVGGWGWLLGTGCSGNGGGESTPADSQPAAEEWFADVTESWGVDFVHDAGPTGTYFMPQSMGSGLAVLDCDGDGLLDLYWLQFGGPQSSSVNRLYRQVQAGKFEDITAGSGLDVAGHCHGVAIGDVNNDGLPDVLLTFYGSVRLFLNRGQGRFEDVTSASGLLNPLWGASCAFLDYDRDGWLDIVVVNYLDYDPKVECRSPEGKLDFCGPNAFPPVCSKLFRHRGLAGGVPRYEDVSLTSGLGRLAGPGLGVTVADFDGDGWPDIFVANDGAPNRLWMNQRDGTFRDEAASRGVALTVMGKAYAGMGVAIGDTDNNGLFDIYVTHLGSETHTLWRQGPRGLFRDQTAAAGLMQSQWRGTGFGTLMADFNNDGSPDIAQVNGRVHRGGPAQDARLGFWETYAERNQLFANDGKGKFRDISEENPAFCGYWNVGRGLVAADLDGDGGVDLIVNAIGSRARIFRNVCPQRGHWLALQVVDPKLKREAYGAEVRVRAGGREWVRTVQPAESYLSSSSPYLHIGLGTVTAVDAVEVRWPDGQGEVERFTIGGVDRRVCLRRGEGMAVSSSPGPSPSPGKQP